MPDTDQYVELRLEIQRLTTENEELRKWGHHLETSIGSLVSGLAQGLQEWVEALRRMSPLSGDGEPPVEPD